MNLCKNLLAVFIAASMVIVGCGGCSHPADVEVELPEPEVVVEEEVDIEYEECSGFVGDHPCNFEFLDQNGEEWNLWNHTGTVLVVDFSTIWCSVCKNIAPDTQAHQDAYTDLGYDLLWVTVLVADQSNGTVELEEAQEWADTYGITTAPVLAGDRSVIDLTAEEGIPASAWPTFIVIDEEMRITFGQLGWSEDSIISAVDDVLGL